MLKNPKILAGASLAALMVVLAQAEAAAEVRRERQHPRRVKAGGKRASKKRVRPRTAARREARRVSRLRERARQVEPLIAAAAVKYGVDPYAIWAIAYKETRFRWWLVSPAGARGMMQFMPGTAEQYGLRNPFDVAQSIDAAARYVRKAMIQFEGRLDLTWASYNAGFGAVEAYRKGITIKVKGGKTINPKGIKTGGVPPYRETMDYVAGCWRVYNAARSAGLFSAEVLARSKAGVLPPAEGARKYLASYRLNDPELAYLGGPQNPAFSGFVATAAPSNNAARGQAAAVDGAKKASAAVATEEVFYDVHSGARYVVRGGEIVRPVEGQGSSIIPPESLHEQRRAVAARSVFYGAGGE